MCRLLTSSVLLRSVVLTSLCALLSSCGYTFQGSGSILPPDVKRISIPLVENNSTEPGLATVVTEALRDRFERFGVLVVVDELGDADAVLKATILSVKRDTHSVTSRTDTALQFNTSLSISGELRRVTGPILWRNPRLVVTKPFGATSGVVVTSSSDFAGGSLGSSDLGALDNREVSRGQEQEAFAALADDAAKKIYDEAVTPDF